MSDIVQYLSLGIGLTGVIYSSIVHFLHKNSYKNNDINQTIKFQNIDQNINSIKELFQKIIKSNLFQEIKQDGRDLENQIKNKIEDINTFEYDKIKEVVNTEKKADRNTVIAKVSNILQLSQNIQNHIDTQQASDNRLKTINRKTQDQKISIYEIANNKSKFFLFFSFTKSIIRDKNLVPQQILGNLSKEKVKRKIINCFIIDNSLWESLLRQTHQNVKLLERRKLCQLLLNTQKGLDEFIYH